MTWQNPLLEENLAAYPHHAETSGIPHGWQPEHVSERCAWCDAIRWRRWMDWLRAAGKPEMVEQMISLTGSKTQAPSSN